MNVRSLGNLIKVNISLPLFRRAVVLRIGVGGGLFGVSL